MYNILIVMYISEIDNILDQTLDKFMYTWIIEPKIDDILKFSILIKEVNFIKYQKNINNIINYGIELISNNDLEKIVTKNSNIFLIKNLISKYLSYYLFILIGINYTGKIELFNNNIIEFSRNQVNYPLKIDNFFTTESNSNIIKVIVLIKELYTYISKLNNKKTNNDIISNELDEFLKLYGEENIKKMYNLLYNKSETKQDNDKIIIDHSIIKIMIYLNLFKANEKKEIYNLIETTEISNGEFIFIDVVVSQEKYIDYNFIESLLTPKEIKTSLPERIYEIINEDFSEEITNKKKYFTDIDLKIQKLLDTHIVVPIVDDFLLYHKDNEKYEKQGEKIDIIKKRDDTKIKYIINKINTASEYYRNPVEIKKIFYTPLNSRNAILVNSNEDAKIITKMRTITKLNNENYDLINDLITYRLYPYISFKDIDKNGFMFSSQTSINCIRNISFNKTFKNFNLNVQTRIISENMLVNIVGFAFIKKNTNLECINVDSFININETTKNPIDIIKLLIDYKIKEILFNTKNNDDNNYYWIYDLDKNKYKIPFYNISDTMSHTEMIKIITSYFYDYLIESVINNMKENINNSDINLINKFMKKYDTVKLKFNDIDNIQFSKYKNELEYLIYYNKSLKIIDTNDNNEDLFPGLYGNVYKLSQAPIKVKSSIVQLKFKFDYNDIENKDNIITTVQPELDFSQSDYDTNDHLDGVCQHIISWDKIAELKRTNSSKYMNFIYEFTQQYVDISMNLDSICKSCKSSIDLKKYISDGSFDNSSQSYMPFSIRMDINIEELPEYEKYRASIRNLDKIIERLSSIYNIQGLTGNLTKNNRKVIVKNTIDLVLMHNIYLKKTYLSIRESELIKYGINKNMSNFFIFELDNTIFIYSSKDKDFYKMIKYNNVLTYIIILLIFELNDTQIMSLHNDKICSYIIFKKVGFSLFEGFKIIINKSHDTDYINKYPILCYIIYLMSAFATKYNLWADVTSNKDKNNDIDEKNKIKKANIDKKKFNPTIQKCIIHTIIEILNSILKVNIESVKQQKLYLYEKILTKYYLKQELFKDYNLI